MKYREIMCILKNFLVKMFMCRKGHKNTYMKISRISTPIEKCYC